MLQDYALARQLASEDVMKPLGIGAYIEARRHHRPVNLRNSIAGERIEDCGEIGKTDQAYPTFGEFPPPDAVEQPGRTIPSTGGDDEPDAAVHDLVEPGQPFFVPPRQVGSFPSQVRGLDDGIAPALQYLGASSIFDRVHRPGEGHHTDRFVGLERGP